MSGERFRRFRASIAEADHDLLAVAGVITIIVLVTAFAGVWKLLHNSTNGTDSAAAALNEVDRNAQAQAIRQAQRAAATAREIERQEAAAVEREAQVQQICDEAVSSALEADVFRRIEDPNDDTRVAWVAGSYYPLEYEDKIAMIAAVYVQRFGEYDKTRSVIVRDVISGEVVMTYRPN